MQDFLLFLFLILQTCAIRLLLAEENTFSTFLSRSIEDLPAALFDENLTSDGGQESNWENNVGLPTASNGPLADNTESQILGDERSDCIQSTNPPNPSRLRMRDQRNLFCIPPQEYREPTITSPSSSNTKKQGALLPSSALRLWPDLQQNTEMTKLWIQLNTIPGIDGEKNEEVCEQAEESLLAVARHVPVCFPHPYLLDSPSDVVQPCRLWQDAPPCEIEWEELWCCVWARRRAAEMLDISPSNFEYALRYNAVGLDCEKILRLDR